MCGCPGVAGDRVENGGHGIEAVFCGGGDIAADGQPVSGGLFGLETSADLLLDLQGPQVALALVVRGRDRRVEHEPEHIVFIQTLRPSLRMWIAVPVATVLGVLATIVSGEFRIGWEFLLIDIPLVGAAAWATIMAARLIRQRLARR